jgi:NAD(P)-dependent dehydrogenase (short-subunit alcohol dehydrogenase family)
VWIEQFTVKVHSVLNLVHAGLSWLDASDAASVVLVNGVTAHAPEADMAAVGAARAAVRNLSLTLTTELAPRRIRVNTVSLGAIVTDRQRARYAGSSATVPFEQWCEQEAQRRSIPLRRLGRPEEVVASVALLLSPRSAYTTGASLEISGGLGARF